MSSRTSFAVTWYTYACVCVCARAQKRRAQPVHDDNLDLLVPPFISGSQHLLATLTMLSWACDIPDCKKRAYHPHGCCTYCDRHLCVVHKGSNLHLCNDMTVRDYVSMQPRFAIPYTLLILILSIRRPCEYRNTSSGIGIGYFLTNPLKSDYGPQLILAG